MNYHIREMRKEEYRCLKEFLYEAIYIPNGTEPPLRSIINHPALQVYIEGFGNRQHDRALIAESDGKIVGAVWVRIMNDYGHISNAIPSLAMSILKAYRGQGVGTALLKQLISEVRKAGYAGISLSVQKDNSVAVELYKKTGFFVVDENEEEYIMVINL